MRTKCIECGTAMEVELTRGRPRFFHQDKCRLAAFRKCKATPELGSEYDAKRMAIRRQYKEAWPKSRSPLGLRRQAVAALHENGWSGADISVVLGLSHTRIRQLTR